MNMTPEPPANQSPYDNSSELSRRDVAQLFLQRTPLATLRAKVRITREWKQPFRGFRPQSLTREQFLLATNYFAANLSLLHELCSVFLDSYQVSPDPDIQRRFSQLADRDDLDPSIHSVCLQLATESIVSLPLENLTNAGTHQLDFIATSSDQPDPPAATLASLDLVSSPIDEIADPRTNGETVSPYIREPIPLDWQAPDDHAAELQQAVTAFSRALAAFVQRQLEALYGPAWLRKGCGSYRNAWEAKAEAGTTIEPKTLLGYAELGDLKDIIIMRSNWPAFEPYFKDKKRVEQAFAQIIPLRHSGMHPENRELYLIDQVSGLSWMTNIVREFHPATAASIDILFQQVYTQSQPLEEQNDLAGSKILANLGEFPSLELVGREQAIEQLEEFWSDPFSRVLSIIGAGGVGKTALLEAFTRRLLERPCGPTERPDPEVIIYLTAKDYYLSFMRRDPGSIRFQTLRQLYEVTVETMSGQSVSDKPLAELRQSVLTLAREMRIFFALDNLESLDDLEHEEVGKFLDDLPIPSKAIITTRIDRRIGRRVQLDGLPDVEALELLKSRVQEHDIFPNADQLAIMKELVHYTHGFPLALVYCSNAIGGGAAFEEILENLKGREFLSFLEFSFESSFSRLSTEEIQVLLFLALSKAARTRRNIVSIVNDNEQLSTILNVLLSMSFIRRSTEDKKQVRFVVDNPLLRDYVRKRAPERLSPQEYSRVLKAADVLPADAESPSVSIEVERALQEARQRAYYGWDEGIAVLEDARKTWGDDPRLLAQLGYYYFRVQDRVSARQLLERAIAAGIEAPDTYVHLSLVLFYDRQYDAALRNAETAMTIREPYPMAYQIAAECLLAKARRDRFTLSDSARRDIVQRAVLHLRKSIIPMERSRADEVHNKRSEQLLQHTSVILGSPD